MRNLARDEVTAGFEAEDIDLFRPIKLRNATNRKSQVCLAAALADIPGYGFAVAHADLFCQQPSAVYSLFVENGAAS